MSLILVLGACTALLLPSTALASSLWTCHGASDQSLKQEEARLTAQLKKECRVLFSTSRVPGLGALIRNTASVFASDEDPTCPAKLAQLSNVMNEIDHRSRETLKSSNMTKDTTGASSPLFCYTKKGASPDTGALLGADTF